MSDEEHKLIDIRGEAMKRMTSLKEREVPKGNIEQKIQPDIQPEWILKTPENQERPCWLIPALIIGAVLVVVVIVLGIFVILGKQPPKEKPVQAKATEHKPERITIVKYRSCNPSVCSALDMSSKHDLRTFQNFCPEGECDSTTKNNLCRKLFWNSMELYYYDCQNEKFHHCAEGKCKPVSYGLFMEKLRKFILKYCPKEWHR